MIYDIRTVTLKRLREIGTNTYYQPRLDGSPLQGTVYVSKTQLVQYGEYKLASWCKKHLHEFKDGTAVYADLKGEL
jgi:hypothetical protein